VYLSKKLIAGVAAIIAVVGGSTALATIPSAGGLIHGCYAKHETTRAGVVRVINADTGEHCRSDENPLDWNQQGAPGVSGYEVVDGPFTPIKDGQILWTKASCPAGKKVFGGGFTSSGWVDIGASIPNVNGTDWEVAGYNTQGQLLYLQAYAICASVS
jgi:hypothetical protein